MSNVISGRNLDGRAPSIGIVFMTMGIVVFIITVGLITTGTPMFANVLHGSDGNQTGGTQKQKCVIQRSSTSYELHYFRYKKWRLTRMALCGEQLVNIGAITRGDDSIPGSWPWQVLVMAQVPSIYCGGTLIELDWVLTAAHCVGLRGQMTVNVALTAPRGEEAQQWKIFEVSHKFVHPQYEPSNPFHDDIALLRLWPTTKKTAYVFPACLPSHAVLHSFMSAPCFVTGLGATDGRNHRTRPRTLQQLRVSIMANDSCKTRYHADPRTRLPLFVDPVQKICLEFNKTTRDAGTCKGDSGGPLNCMMGNRFYVMGVIHIGEKGCQNKYFPNVVMRVSFFKNWIEKTIEENP